MQRFTPEGCLAGGQGGAFAAFRWDHRCVRSWLARLITSEYPDPDDTRRAQTLNAMMVASIPVGLLTAALVFPYQNGPISAFFLALTAICFAGFIWLTHRGWLGIAVYGFAAVLLMVTIAQPLATGDLSTNALLIPLGTVMLVYVFPLRQWYVVAGWVVAALGILQLGTDDESTVVLPRHVWLLNAAMATMLTVAVVTYAARQLTQAVRRESELSHQLSAREARLVRLEELANTDPLTGFLNRRPLAAALEEVGDRCAYAVLDLDNFKAVNDVHSHAVGDALLLRFSGVVAEMAQPDDLLFRLGGDEFLIVRPDTSASRLGAWIHRLRAAMADQQWPDLPPSYAVTFSAGVVGGGGLSAETALDLADKALYKAKEQGRDRIVVMD